MKLRLAPQDVFLEVLFLVAGSLHVAQHLVDRVQTVFLKKN